MTPERWQRQKEIFSQLQSASPEDRIGLLDLLCAGDHSFRAEIERLLLSHSEEDAFLDNGAASLGLAAGAVLAGRFELLRLAGEGGMGQVWAARDNQLHEDVAIKTIHQRISLDPSAIDRFKRELQLARRIAHPNVCKLYDLFEDHDSTLPRVFLTMELLAGETLAARLKREGRIPPAQAIAWMRQLCAALEAAHAAGIVHRDLKPGNIMLCAAPDGAERLVVTDFGLARAHSASINSGTQTATGVAVGTPDYMAPEQIRGDQATPATDIYALGLILYEMLKGERPFQGKHTLDSWMRRIRETPPKLSSSGLGVPTRLDAIIARCLEYAPEARFSSAAALSSALDGGRSYTWKWPSGGRTAIAAASALVLAAWGFLFFRASGQPNREAQLWYQDARRDLAEGAALRASNQLRRAISAAPQFASAYAALAEAQIDLDQNSLARESILRASALAASAWRLPREDATHIEGVSRLLLRDCPAAIASFRASADTTAAEQRPNALASLARAQERCGQNADARKTLAEAAQLDPRNGGLLVRSAMLAPAAESEGFLKTAEAIYRERANFEGVAEVQIVRGGIETTHDQLDLAAQALNEAMSLAKTTSNVHQQIRILFQQSNVARRRGAFDEARALAEQSMQLARQNDLETLTLQGIFAAANIHIAKNQNAEAKAELDRALDIASRYRDEGNQAQANLALASVYQRMMQPENAAQAIRAALPYYERIRNGRNIASAHAILGRIEFDRAQYTAAAEHSRRLLEQARQLKSSDLELNALGDLVSALAESGSLSEAAPLAAQAARLAHERNRKRPEAFAVISQGEIASLLGRFDEASKDFAAAQRLIAAMEPATAKSPAFRLRLAIAADAIHAGRPALALAVLRKSEAPSDSPAVAIATSIAVAAAQLAAGDAARSRATIAGVAEKAAQIRNVHFKVKAQLVEAQAQVASGASSNPQLISDLLAFIHLDNDPMDYLAAQLLAAGPTSPAVSQSLSALRLKLAGRDFESWSHRPDVARSLAQVPIEWRRQ